LWSARCGEKSQWATTYGNFKGMAKPIRIGVIGCGAIHSTHCNAIKKIDAFELSGVMDCVESRAQKASEEFGCLGYSDLNQLFENVDAVTLAVPSGLHAEIGGKAAKAGKHVLSEKPIDVSVGSADRLITACRKAGIKLAVVSQHRFASDVRKLREAVQECAMGRILSGDMYNKWYRSQQYYDSGDWRGTWDLDGGGCLMNQGVHYVDLLQWIMGGVKSVQAQVRTAAHERIEVEDIANALVEFKNGAVGVIQGSTSTYPGMAERIEVQGLYGGAILEADTLKYWKVDADRSQLGLYGDGINKQPTPKVEFLSTGSSDSGSGASDPTAIWGEQHRLQFEDFAQAIIDDRKPEVSGEDAIAPLKVILAIYKSAKSGGVRVEIE